VFRFITVVAVACFLAASASAGIVGNINITIDQNCNGILSGPFAPPAALPCALMPDPGPGGLANVLTYDMLNPPSLVTGDVFIYNLATFADVVRFNPSGGPPDPGGSGSIAFYSNPFVGVASLADTVSAPSVFYANTITLYETNGIVVYTPTSGQPGFVAGAPIPVTYTIIADVPEPTSLLLALSGGAFLILRRRAVR
jgi:hypothetical protein